MQNIKSGFTLIELLVVMLIIGILASVALPQYQKAVNKSRASTALATLRAIHQAQEVYRLENGEYASDLSELSLSIPSDVSSSGWTSPDQNHPNKYMFSCNGTGSNCNASAASPKLPSFEYHGNDGKLYCLCSMNHKDASVESICQSFGGVYSHTYTNKDHNIEAKYYQMP